MPSSTVIAGMMYAEKHRHREHFKLVSELGAYGTRAVREELEANPQLWDAHTARKIAPGTPHSKMSDIWVRYRDVTPFESGERPWAEFNNEHVPVNYPAWHCLPSLQPIIFDLMAKVRGEMLGGVLITKIPPGMGIDRHVDRGWHVEYYEKFYLTLQNDMGSVFGCQHRDVTEELTPSLGDVWLFDNRKVHWVVNDSCRDRITCIICIRTDKFGRKPLEEI